jgi:hypothetical protein
MSASSCEGLRAKNQFFFTRGAFSTWGRKKAISYQSIININYQFNYCCLYHYEVNTLFGLWQANGDGGKNLVPKAWGGRFPFQVKVTLVTPGIIELPKTNVIESVLNPATGKIDNVLEGGRAETLLQILRNPPTK